MPKSRRFRHKQWVLLQGLRDCGKSLLANRGQRYATQVLDVDHEPLPRIPANFGANHGSVGDGSEYRLVYVHQIYDSENVLGNEFGILFVFHYVFEHSYETHLFGVGLDADFFFQFTDDRFGMFFAVFDSSAGQIVHPLEGSAHFLNERRFASARDYGIASWTEIPDDFLFLRSGG